MNSYSSEHADVANWLRSQAAEGCCRVILCQRVGSEQQHVREWSVPDGLDADALAKEITKRMLDEARVLRGPSMYLLFSFKPDTSSYFDRRICRVEGIGASADTLLGDTEQADPRGIVSQMMRHNEASAKISLGQTLAIVEHYKQILRERDARIATLEERHTQVIELQERLMSMQHARDVDLIREKRSDKKQAFVRDKLDMLAPVILSKVLDAGTPKGQGTMFGEELLRQFLKSLGPEQMFAITNALGPEQVVTLHEIFERYSARETERQQKVTTAEVTGIANGVRDGGATRPSTEGTETPLPNGAEPSCEEKT